MFETQLKEIGLTENEVSTYLILLENGAMNPSAVAHKLNTHRGYMYDSLERMKEKGVVSEIYKKGKKHYQANSPESILEMLRLKMTAFEEIVPKLNQVMSSKEEDTKVELHQGSRVYRTIIKDIIATVKENDEVLLTGVDENLLLNHVEPIYLRQYFTIIKERNIKEKIIIKKGFPKSESFEYRELDPEFIGNVMQAVYGGKVALFIMGNPYQAIIIENDAVANTYRRQFQLLWEKAE